MDMKKTKLADLLEALKNRGAIFDHEQSYIRFSNFGSVENEYHALNNSIGIRFLPEKGIYKLQGTDTLDFLHRVTTNDVKNLQVDNVIRTIFTNENGRIIDYVTLINYGDHLLMTGCPEYEEKLVQWIEKYIIVDDVEVKTLQGELIIFEILGQNADHLAEFLSGSSGSSMDENKLIHLSLGDVSFNFMRHRGENKDQRYWIIVEQKHSAELINRILDSKLGNEIRLTGEEAYDIFRIENGIPGPPNEFNDNINPHEAGIINDVSFTKGCYIGQEVIARLDTYDKVQKHLRFLIFQSETVPEGSYKLYTEDGIRAGYVTSLIRSRKIGQTVGLGYIRKDHSKDGTKLKARIENNNVSEIPGSVDVLVVENPS